MQLRLGARVFADGDLLVAAVCDSARVPVAPPAGSDLLDLGAAPADTVAAVRRRFPGTVLAVDPGGAAAAAAAVEAGADVLNGDTAEIAEMAARRAVGLVCPPALLGHALTVGVRRDALIVRCDDPTDAGRVRDLVATGFPVLVPVEADAGELSGALAAAAVHAWLGVRVFRTRHVAQTRPVLDMAATIRGSRPPAWTRRGLA